MDPHTAEAFAWMIGIAGFWLVVVIVSYLWIARRPRKADRAYRDSPKKQRKEWQKAHSIAASYDDEGVHGDVVIVPMVSRPFADSEGGRSRG